MKFPVSEYLYAVNEILKRNDTKYIYTHIYIQIVCHLIFRKIIKDYTIKDALALYLHIIQLYILIQWTEKIIYLFRKAFDGIFERFTYSSTIKSDREESGKILRWQVLIYRIKITRYGSMDLIDSLWIPRGYERFVTVDHGTFDRSCMRPVTRDR